MRRTRWPPLSPRLSADPKPLADELRTCAQTLIHGDLRLGNAGFDGDRVVLIDWGDRTGMAPPAVELGWFIGFDAKRFALSRDDIVSVFRSLYGDRFEERALDLASSVVSSNSPPISGSASWTPRTRRNGPERPTSWNGGPDEWNERLRSGRPDAGRQARPSDAYRRMLDT